jgi:hypothetical protein
MKKEFNISSEIYSEDKITKAIEDFIEVWDINFNNWNLIISWDSNEEIEEIFNEFMNYLVWLINE